MTLWNLPAALEDQFDARWARWLEERHVWTDFFSSIERPPADLLETMQALDLVGAEGLEIASKLRRSAEGRAVPLPGVLAVSDTLITQLAAGFSRGEPGKLALPYARMDD